MQRPLTILLIAAVAIAAPHCGHYAGGGGTIPAGFDAFQTAAGTEARFIDAFTIPAGFFDRDSAPFSGTVALTGTPIGSYEGRSTGAADTIVVRKSDAKFGGGYGEASVPVEVAMLSLKSTGPIQVVVAGAVQQWDVTVGLSSGRRSDGSMTINRRDAKGGTFSSSFVVYPQFTFTRRSDGTRRVLDAGTMDLPPGGQEALTLRTQNVPYASRCSASRTFCPGVDPSNLASPPFSEESRLMRHNVFL